MWPRSTIVSLLLFLCGRAVAGQAPAAAEPATSVYTPAAGPFEVSVVERLVLTDDARGKRLELRIQYPAALAAPVGRKASKASKASPLPLIIFSHGAGGSKDGAVTLTRHWAAHGYITIQPTHDDCVALRRAHGERYTILDAVKTALQDPTAWVNRPRDISHILDSLDNIEKRLPALRGRIDRERIGMAGHSFGAMTTAYLSGASVTLPGSSEPKTLGDERINAFLALSPQGPGRMGFTGESWSAIQRPFMIVTGSKDNGGRKEYTPRWRLTPFEKFPPGDKYAVWVEGANHMTFSGDARRAATGRVLSLLPQRSKIEEQEQRIRYVQMASTAFWDAYLKAVPAARRSLASDALERHSGSIVKILRK
jgi:predicted dienelactone hydrolase